MCLIPKVLKTIQISQGVCMKLQKPRASNPKLLDGYVSASHTCCVRREAADWSFVTFHVSTKWPRNQVGIAFSERYLNQRQSSLVELLKARTDSAVCSNPADAEMIRSRIQDLGGGGGGELCDSGNSGPGCGLCQASVPWTGRSSPFACNPFGPCWPRRRPLGVWVAFAMRHTRPL